MLELTDSSLVHSFDSIDSSRPDCFLIVGQEETPELFSLEEVFALVLRLRNRQNIIALQVARLGIARIKFQIVLACGLVRTSLSDLSDHVPFLLH